MDIRPIDTPLTSNVGYFKTLSPVLVELRMIGGIDKWRAAHAK